MILYIYYKYMHYFFDTEETNLVKEITIYLSMLLWLFFVRPPLPPYLEGLSGFLMIFLLTWMYEAGLVKKLVLALFLYGISFLCEMISTYVLMLFDENMRADTFAAAQTILVLLLMYIFEQLTELAGGRAKKLQLRLAESENAKRQLAGYSNQLEVIKSSEEKVRGLRHDLKHHLNELMFLAERDKASEIKAYIKSMDDFMTYSKEYVSSGNMDMDSLLNFMLDAAKNELGDISCKVSIPKELALEPFDLNVILGNLLDNAILAAKQTQEKHLKVRISYKMGMLFINIENSYAGALKKEGSRYLSTKADSAPHGMGIENVRHAVEKYDGALEIKDENNLFQVRAVLYVPEIKQRISP